MFKHSTHVICSLSLLLILFIAHSAYNTVRLYAVNTPDRTKHNAEEQSALQENPTQSCNLSGLIGANTTWSPSSCNPYIATGSVIVDTAYTLTIEAGTTIKWNPGTALTIRGTLLARGSAEQPVTFTSNQATPKAGDWAGIEFVGSSKDAEYDANENYLRGSIIQHSIIEYAGKKANQSQAPAIDAESKSPYIDNTIIRNNQGTGVNIGGKTIHFTNNQVLANLGTGVYIDFCLGDRAGFVDTLIHKNNVSNNQDSGIIIFASGDCNPIISENVVTNNSNNRINALAGGIHCEGPSIGRPTFTLIKNIVSNNSTRACGGGIKLRWTQYHVLEGNLIERNQSKIGGGVCFDLMANIGLMLDNDIKNNVSEFGGGGVVSSGNTEFHYNRFENNLDNGLPNHLSNGGGQSTPNINAENNWWGSSNLATIESSIYHFVDDSTQGVVDFEPFCNESCTPPEPLKVFLPMARR